MTYPVLLGRQFLLARLNVRHCLMLWLRELDFGTQQERAKKQVRQWQHHIEVLVHVPMMEQVMPIESVEDPRLFQFTCLG